LHLSDRIWKVFSLFLLYAVGPVETHSLASLLSLLSQYPRRWKCLSNSQSAPNLSPDRPHPLNLSSQKYRAWIYSVGCATLSLTIWNGAGLPFIYLVLGLFVCIPLYRLSWWHPLHGFPGPRIYRISELPMFYHAVRGTRHRVVKRMHDTYGPIVRTGVESLRSLRSSHSFFFRAQFSVLHVPDGNTSDIRFIACPGEDYSIRHALHQG
jgi:hypothetical protein